MAEVGHYPSETAGAATRPDSRRGRTLRPRLLDRLVQAHQARATLILAPAGYGKTVLLEQWIDRLHGEGHAVVYLSLNAKHRDPVHLLSSLVDAIHAQARSVSPFADACTIGEVEDSPDQRAEQIAKNLTSAEIPMFLILDNLQVAGAPAASCLRVLIENAQPGLHVVMASRARPDIPLARLRVQDELCEITTRDLRFTGAEVAELLAHFGARDLAAEDLDVLESRCEGWGAGLKLAALAYTACPAGGNVADGFSGERTELWDFFMEDVLAALPDDLRDILVKISLLDRFSAPLCDALTFRKDCRALLEHCERTGLFVFAEDDTRNWYRFHPLFRDFLQRDFTDRFAGESAVLHGRASAWYFEAGMFVEAFEQAQKAKDPIRAAEILDTQIDAMFSAGLARTVRRLAAEIPAHIQAFYPRIMLAAAWPLTVQWKFAEARNLIAASRARLAEMKQLGISPRSELESMQNILCHREMILAQVLDDMAAVETSGERLIANYRDGDPFVTGSIYSAYLHSRRERYKLQNLDRLEATADDALRECASPHAIIAHLAVSGATRFLTGDCDQAAARLREGLDIAVRLLGPQPSIGAMCALPLAEVLYERNQTDDAARLLEEYLPVSTEMGIVDQLISGWLTQSRLFRAKGDNESAVRMLDTASGVAARFGFERLGLFAAEERVRQMLRSGRPDEASRAIRRSGLKPSDGAIMPARGIDTRDEARALMWVSWAEIENRIADGLAVARQWRSFLTGVGAVRRGVIWDIRTAHLLLHDGETRGAKRILRRALATAAPCGLMRCFLDEPALLRSLLLDGPPPDRDSGDATDRLSIQLLDDLERENGRRPTPIRAPTVPVTGLGGSLNSHELEVLRLTAGGMTNREVGDRLGMTEGSIKWHLQQIYDKMGVRRRMQATERARQLGLIN